MSKCLLISYAKINSSIDKTLKPFPLLYEEIYLNAAKERNTPELRLKKYIASQTRKLKPNGLHEQILDLGIENIMTTNYDLLFEKAAGLATKKIVNKGFIKESLYSIFRFHQTDNHKIWHIHGSESAPKTITLGYEQYSGYLQQMRNYVVTGTKGNYKKKDFLPLRRRLSEGIIDQKSWIDFFFTHDVYILGLNLDFVEMHLWWLLTYRARAMATGKIKTSNRIYYFYPKKFEKESKHKLDMFRVNGIEVISEKLWKENKLGYYEKVIRKINMI